MVTIWRSRQRCADCGWTGITPAHRWVIRCCAGYGVMCVVVFALHVGGILDVYSLGWPFLVVALAWYYAMPSVIWRWNACGGCKKRMGVELLSPTDGRNA